jgi:hypothetical protein
MAAEAAAREKADLTYKRNDTREAFRGTLEQLDVEATEAAGEDKFKAVDLTNATAVHIYLFTTKTEQGSSRRVKTGPVERVDPAAGTVEYEWEADDLAKAGTYQMEIEVVWDDADPQTFPNDGYYTILVLEDLGPTTGEE